MTTSIYTNYDDLPASIEAKEKFNKAVEIFELAVKAIKAELKEAEEKFVAEREEKRKASKWEYIMNEPTINEYGKHYSISRKAINPVAGDTNFYKDIDYASFKIVNNVFISTGGGNSFQQICTGDIITKEVFEQLENGIVPEIFKNKPIFTKENHYLSGS